MLPRNRLVFVLLLGAVVGVLGLVYVPEQSETAVVGAAHAHSATVLGDVATQSQSVIPHDLGILSPDEIVHASIAFENASDAPWSVRAVQKDCSCIISRVEPSVILPGGAGVVGFEYHAPKSAGRIQRRLMLAFHEAAAPTLIFDVHGAVRELVKPVPGVVDFGELVPGRRITRFVRLMAEDSGEVDVDLSSLVNPVSWIRLERVNQASTYGSDDEIIGNTANSGVTPGSLMVAKESRGATVRLVADPPLDIARKTLNERIVVSVTRPRALKVDVPVKGTFFVPFELTPRQCFFGYVKAGSQVARQLRLELGDAHDEAMLEKLVVTHDLDDEFTVTLQTKRAERRAIVDIAFSPRTPGFKSGEVRLSRANEMSVVIPVRAFVSRGEP